MDQLPRQLDSYVLLDLYSNRDGFQFVFKQMNVLVLAHALPTRISPWIASPIVTFLSSLSSSSRSNSTSGALITSAVEYAVLIVLVVYSLCLYLLRIKRRDY